MTEHGGGDSRTSNPDKETAQPLRPPAPMVSGGVMVALGVGLIVLGIVLQMHNLAPYLWNLLLISVGIAFLLTAAGAITQLIVTTNEYAVTLAGAAALVALTMWGMTKLNEDKYSRVIVDVPNVDLSQYHVAVSIE